MRVILTRRMWPYFAIAALLLVIAVWSYATYPGVQLEFICQDRPELLKSNGPACYPPKADYHKDAALVLFIGAALVLAIGLLGDFWGQIRLYGLVALSLALWVLIFPLDGAALGLALALVQACIGES